MKTLFNLFVMILLIGMNQIRGQNIFTAIPPSPNSAELAKYGDIPVSLYTGVPSVNIPLWELSCGKLSVPISLSYHASGIKVDQIASNVGLGWSLNAGGAITRSVRDLPDESVYGYYYQIKNLKNTYYETLKADYDKLADFSNGTIECMPDMFYYNFVNKTGKFALGADQKMHLIPYQNLQIDAGIFDPNSSKFSVIDESGTIYIFEDLEESTTIVDENGSFQTTNFISSWYLSKIISNDFYDTIQFIYNTEVVEYDQTLSETMICPVFSEQFSTSGCLIGSCTTKKTNMKSNSIKAVVLIEIFSRNFRIRFNSVKDRIDLPSAVRLSSIQIYTHENKLTSNVLYKYNDPSKTNEKLIREFEFTYFYERSASNLTGSDTIKNNRLFLKSVREKNGVIEKPEYKFTYNTKSINSKYELPPRGSKQVDHWGYFNAAKGNDQLNTLIPSYRQPYPPYAISSGADREPNPEYVIAGLLAKIDYPTGGYTAFNYEINTYIPKDNQIKEMPSASNITASAQGTDNIVPDFHGTANSIPHCLDIISIEDKCETDPNYDMAYFTAPEGLSFVQIEIKISGIPSNLSKQYNTPFARVAIKNGTTGNFEYLYSANENKDYSEVIRFYPDPETTYILSAEAFYQDEIRASVYIRYFMFDTSSSYAGPGARIKKMLSFDGGKESVREYSYPDNNSNWKSSGTLYVKPLYYFATVTKDYVNCLAGYPLVSVQTFREAGIKGVLNAIFDEKKSFSNVSGIFWIDYFFAEILEQGEEAQCTCPLKSMCINHYHSANNLTLGAVEGSPLGYAHVIEKIGENGSFGRNDYTYSQYPNPVNYGFPFTPANTYEWGRGNLIKEVNYENFKGTLIKRKETSNTYTIDKRNGYEITGFKVGRIINHNGFYCEQNPLFTGTYLQERTVISSKWIYLSESVTKMYDEANPSLFMESKTRYYYDNPNHAQISRIEEGLSDGRTSIMKIKYAPDFNNADKTDPYAYAISEMKNTKHMHSQPIENLKLIRNINNVEQVIGGELYLYAGISPDIYKIKEVYNLHLKSPEVIPNTCEISNNQLIKNSHYKREAELLSYDSRGNIESYSGKDNIPISCIWGYDQSLPVAQVFNASNNEIAYAGFESKDQGKWNYTYSGITSQKAVSGKSCYSLSSGQINKTDLPSGNYILSFWTDGSANISGFTSNTPLTRNGNAGWVFYQYEISGSGTLTLSGSSLIDDLCLYPADATITCYTYDSGKGMTSAADQNQINTFYEYDDLGRLKIIRDKDLNIINRYIYNYKN